MMARSDGRQTRRRRNRQVVLGDERGVAGRRPRFGEGPSSKTHDRGCQFTDSLIHGKIFTMCRILSQYMQLAKTHHT